MKRYRPSETVDFLIIGAGASGGVMAKELSSAGFSVVVLEQGPYLHERDFKHDEFGTIPAYWSGAYGFSPGKISLSVSES